MKNLIISKKEKNTLSKNQKKFNKLLKKIEQSKKQLEELKAVSSYLREKANEKLIPEKEKILITKVECIWYYNKMYEVKGVTAAQKRVLSELIASNSESLLEINKEEYKSLTALLEKHMSKENQEKRQIEKAEEIESLKQEFKSHTGIDLDINPEDSLQDILKKIQEQIIKLSAEEDNFKASTKQKTEKKTKKQLEKEEKNKNEEAEKTKSVRSIYMELVKEFHPDREIDEQEQLRKTAIMQRVTEAYSNNDLLELLKLQLELEQIKEDTIENIADEKLNHYNKVLNEQVLQLEDEIHNMSGMLASMYDNNFWFYFIPTLKNAEFYIENEFAKIQQHLKTMKAELTIPLEASSIKEFVAKMKAQKKKSENHDIFSLIF